MAINSRVPYRRRQLHKERRLTLGKVQGNALLGGYRLIEEPACGNTWLYRLPHLSKLFEFLQEEGTQLGQYFRRAFRSETSQRRRDLWPDLPRYIQVLQIDKWMEKLQPVPGFVDSVDGRRRVQ